MSVHFPKVAYKKRSLITTGSRRTDKFFMMRDTLVSYITPDLVPLYYRKGALEGKRYNVDEVWYSYPGGGKVQLFGDLIEAKFLSTSLNEWNVGSALSLIMMLLILLSLGLLNKVDPDNEGGGMV